MLFCSFGEIKHMTGSYQTAGIYFALTQKHRSILTIYIWTKCQLAVLLQFNKVG